MEGQGGNMAKAKGPDDPQEYQEYVDLTVRLTELDINIDLKMILRLIVRKLYKM
jgi:hypothetical protein